MVNIILALSSMPGIKHVVELSLSPFFQYSYSVMTKVLTRWKCSREELLKFVLQWIDPPNLLSNGLSYYSFIHDFTKLSKPFSECLENRSYHVTNNPIGGRRQLSGGYDFACLAYDSERSGHCPIVECKRLDGDENQLELAREQIELLMEHFNFKSDLVLIKTDSNYGRIAFLYMAYQYSNMLILSRLQSGMNVYKPYEGEQKRGRKRIYGQAYVLKDNSGEKAWFEPKTRIRGITYQHCIHELPHDEKVEYEATLGGQEVIVQATRWNGLLLRSKREFNMEQNPLDILSVKILDSTTREEVYKRPMYLAVAGKRRSDILTQDVPKQYKGRYQIEPQFRFIKYNLLLDRLQTPKVEHIDTWATVIQLCSWFLYLTAQEVKEVVCQKWQQHLKKQNGNRDHLTPSEARRAAFINMNGYDLVPFSPTPFIIGKGREDGTKMPKREKHRIRKKTEIRAEKLARTA